MFNFWSPVSSTNSVDGKDIDKQNEVCIDQLFFFFQESMKNLRDSLPSWIDSERAGAVGSLKVCLNINHTVAISFIWDIF